MIGEGVVFLMDCCQKLVLPSSCIKTSSPPPPQAFRIRGSEVRFTETQKLFWVRKKQSIHRELVNIVGWAGQFRPFRVWGLSLASFCGGVHSDLVGWWKGALILISAYVESRNVGPWMCWGPTWVKESPSVLLAKQEPLDYHQDFGLVSRVSSHWPKSATTMGCYLKMERAG